MLGIRFNSGIDAWINGRVVVICLMDYSLYIFSEALFSQMNILDMSVLSSGDQNTYMRNIWA